jgi:hypothetical protein
LVFTDGVRDYVEQLERVVPLRGGVVRTALDIGCGVCTRMKAFHIFDSESSRSKSGFLLRT